ncbi:hypothetical protein Cgig2_015390 [Carnegiea gigantea]|uniref:RNase H type-1 domain-containing protein n=1 Tax=Carnegiea gigantea TaxID=171969 RepID=A0A9Q1Q637_9CARY|nr:hypothetical protein Cgig2_015390 [Carnegiea gigantea]
MVGAWSSEMRQALLRGTGEGPGFNGSEVEEARAGLFALRKAKELGFNEVILEGNCMSIIAKLKTGNCPNTEVDRVWLEDGLGKVMSLACEDLCTDFASMESQPPSHGIPQLSCFGLENLIVSIEATTPTTLTNLLFLNDGSHPTQSIHFRRCCLSCSLQHTCVVHSSIVHCHLDYPLFASNKHPVIIAA